jgi:molybdopterin converting factor small subunit
MKTKVTFYGSLTDVVGSNSVEVTADKIADLLDQLFVTYPELRRRKFLTAIDTSIVGAESVIPAGTSVCLMPPFAGG